MFHYQSPPNLLQDKIILVTGAGSGLGRAAALAYARHGATVLLLGRDEAALDAVYDRIEAEQCPDPALFVLDLERADENNYFELANLIHGEFGRLDGLLHNAGVFAPILPLEHHALDSWQRLLQVNLTAPFALTRACLPLLRAAESASLIFTSSTAGRELRAYWGGYAIAKHALENLAALFHLELENTSNIRVNSLNPGPCATALRRVGFPAEDPATLPTPEALMAVYLYLMGDDSKGERGKQFSAQ
ncbi:MAG: YciK family oxidoreductase [Pseudomonadales bacterium]|jgi:NAD(P)-dependent dehydrogenase (short-subunit alcohol dehydrogenase family)|nr:YciK family oxidoreductase [Pseudomonadales bacterium]